MHSSGNTAAESQSSGSWAPVRGSRSLITAQPTPHRRAAGSQRAQPPQEDRNVCFQTRNRRPIRGLEGRAMLYDCVARANGISQARVRGCVCLRESGRTEETLNACS